MMDINTLLTLDLAEYTTALEALADQMMLEEPRDIDYMRRRKLDTGREFAVWNFTVGYCMNAALSLLRAQATENVNGDTADLATLNNSATRLCDWFSGAFDVTGKMDDTTAILARSRDLYAQVETHDQFAALTRATERYLVQRQQRPAAEPKLVIRGLETPTTASPAFSIVLRVSRHRREKAKG